MLHELVRTSTLPGRISRSPGLYRRSGTKSSASGLRILYCGSDEFSAVSLKRLDEARLQGRGIQSIDVVYKTGKPSGRGLKRIRDVPIKGVANGLRLPCHDISTFTGWTPPEPLDLIVAVSFGLKVPPRILNGSSFGGLNLHPSLLPDLRGPAPLHHTLIQGRKTSGVTLQTLHPQHFDQGSIIAQKSFDLPREGNCDFKELLHYSAQVGAELLVESLVNWQFRNEDRPAAVAPSDSITHARKVVAEDAHVDWATWPAERCLRVQRALGYVWSDWQSRRNDTRRLRVQWHGLELAERPPKGPLTATPGEPLLVDDGTDHQEHKPQGQASATESLVALIPTCDGRYLTCQRMTIEGRPKHEAAVQGMKMLLDGRV